MTQIHPTYIVLGQLKRDFLITPELKVRADQLGGNLLYASEGVGLWLEQGESIGLVARVGEDFPRAWLTEIAQRGHLIEGIHVLPEEIDLREFRAYSDLRTIHTDDPVSHFSRLGLTMPRSLLGYESFKEPKDLLAAAPVSLRQSDLPESYQGAKAAHLCSMDYISQSLMPAALRQRGIETVTLDPGPYLHREHWDQVKSAAIGLTAFLPSEEELKDLFFGQTDDVLEMMEAVGGWGVGVVVVKRSWKGQLLYDSYTKRRYDIPAYPSKMVDPTGAGDVFAGGFLAGLVKTGSPLMAVMHGNVAASIAVEGTGAFYTQDIMPGLQQARLESISDSVREV